MILQKALSSNAQPADLLHAAIRFLKSGKTQLLSAEDQECNPGMSDFNFKPYFLLKGDFYLRKST